MARKLRLETEGGLYHVINRGNYRADIFRSEGAKKAFLKCLDEACQKTGWRVHAWCVMSNHYHLAIETPKRNLVEGMRWLQSTFSMRFNRLRKEHGHLFQGRYKSLIVDADRLGGLCHYIHLNPVRAKVCTVESLTDWRWSSFRWLQKPKERASWYSPEVALAQAGTLADSGSGRSKYTAYLDWLSEDEPARKELNFEKMSTDWALGSEAFKKALVDDYKDVAVALKHGGLEEQKLRHELLENKLRELLKKVGKREVELSVEGKSVAWKVAVGAAMKQQTTASNRWLSENLFMGNPDEVSRKISHWLRHPDKKWIRKLLITPNPIV